jgi:hypothetical protein
MLHEIFRLVTFSLHVTRDLVDNNNVALLIVQFALQRNSDQPEDGSKLDPKHAVERSNVRTSY